MPLRSRVLLAAGIVVPLALATACSGSGTAGSPAVLAAPGGGIPAGPAPGSQALSEAGSTLLAPVMSTWAAAYQRRYPNVHIKTAPIGSGKGIAAEAAGDPAAAGRYFQLVWTVDPGYVSAAFGLARTRLRAGDRAGAIAALAAVPDTSSHYLAAR